MGLLLNRNKVYTIIRLYMKAKYALILFVLGVCTNLVGALFKIQHWSGADALLIAGSLLEVGGILLFSYKLLTHPKVKEFLNR